MAQVQADVHAGALARLDALRHRLTDANPGIVVAEQQRRAVVLAHVALSLALILTLSAVISACTTILFPDPDVSLGWGGTAIIAAAAAAFWVGLVLGRRERFEIGAWVTIITIDGFLFAMMLVFQEHAGSLVLGFAAPVVCATILLRAKGTMAVCLLSGVLGTISLIITDISLIDAAFIIGIMVAITALTVVIAVIRERDLLSVERLRQMELADAERLHVELELARRVQLAMLPSSIPDLPGLDLAGFSEPALEASGDFYDVFPLEIGGDSVVGGPAVGVVVCDVAGKGVASALVMSATRGVLRSEAQRGPSPATVLAKVNATLTASIPPGLFVTLCYAIYEPATRTFRWASAGHPHPYRWSAQERSVEELESYGMPLGLVEGSTYDDRVVVLDPGDVVVLYTDGLVEALDHGREMYGFDRARDDFGGVAERPGSAAERLDGVLAALRGFMAGERLHDDVTVVTLSVPDLVDLDALTTFAGGPEGATWTTGR